MWSFSIHSLDRLTLLWLRHPDTGHQNHTPLHKTAACEWESERETNGERLKGTQTEAEIRIHANEFYMFL